MRNRITSTPRRAVLALATALALATGSLAVTAPGAQAADPAPAQAFADLNSDLRDLVDAASAAAVTMGISLTDLSGTTDGQTITVGSQEQVKAASVIKLPLLALLMEKVDDGDLSLTESVHIPAGSANIVGGAGTLQVRTFPLDITIAELMELMVTVSDNSATNVLIDQAGGLDAVNQYIQSLGYKSFWFGRKMMSAAVPPLKENWLNSQDVTSFLTKLYHHDLLSADSSEYIIGLMKRQLVNTKFGAVIPRAVLANKTGELSDVSHDSGFILLPGHQLALSVTTSFGSPVSLNDANASVQKAASIAYKYALNTAKSSAESQLTAAQDARAAAAAKLNGTAALAADAESTKAELAADLTAEKKAAAATAAAKTAAARAACAAKKKALAAKKKLARAKAKLAKAKRRASSAKIRAAKKTVKKRTVSYKKAQAKATSATTAVQVASANDSAAVKARAKAQRAVDRNATRISSYAAETATLTESITALAADIDGYEADIASLAEQLAAISEK